MISVVRPTLHLLLSHLISDHQLHKIQAELTKQELLLAEVAQSIPTERPVLQSKLELNKLLLLEAKTK